MLLLSSATSLVMIGFKARLSHTAHRKRRSSARRPLCRRKARRWRDPRAGGAPRAPQRAVVTQAPPRQGAAAHRQGARPRVPVAAPHGRKRAHGRARAHTQEKEMARLVPHKKKKRGRATDDVANAPPPRRTSVVHSACCMIPMKVFSHCASLVAYEMRHAPPPQRIRSIAYACATAPAHTLHRIRPMRHRPIAHAPFACHIAHTQTRTHARTDTHTHTLTDTHTHTPTHTRARVRAAVEPDVR
jgi:hypothetical protein